MNSLHRYYNQIKNSKSTLNTNIYKVLILVTFLLFQSSPTNFFVREYQQNMQIRNEIIKVNLLIGTFLQYPIQD